MTWSLDARIPVHLLGPGERPADGAALLVEGQFEGQDAPPAPALARFETAATGHALGCACCNPRSPAAPALDLLFLMRVRGEVPWFRAVAAVIRSEEGAAALRAALSEDAVTSSRFRAG